MIKLETPLKMKPFPHVLKNLLIIMFWFKQSLLKLETCVKSRIQLARFPAITWIGYFIDFSNAVFLLVSK